jgi:hypothetical protein
LMLPLQTVGRPPSQLCPWAGRQAAPAHARARLRQGARGYCSRRWRTQLHRAARQRLVAVALPVPRGKSKAGPPRRRLQEPARRATEDGHRNGTPKQPAIQLAQAVRCEAAMPPPVGWCEAPPVRRHRACAWTLWLRVRPAGRPRQQKRRRSWPGKRRRPPRTRSGECGCGHRARPMTTRVFDARPDTPPPPHTHTHTHNHAP